MKIATIGDTHKHEFSLPDADVAIHVGDWSGAGWDKEETLIFSKIWRSLPHRYKISVAGNHDRWCETNHEGTKALLHDPAQGLFYLHDEDITINGIKFYGSPYQPQFCGWAFNLPRGPVLAAKWSRIPDDTDILITHGPPYGHGDAVHPPNSFLVRDIVGCRDLAERVYSIKPKYHLFGHIHGAWGISTNKHTMFVNCSMCNESYNPVHPNIIIDTDTDQIVISPR